MTNEERAFVKRKMQEYMPGVPHNAWGFGPLCTMDVGGGEEQSFPQPTEIDLVYRLEYG